ncbi:MAG: ThuA domain-containing protein [Anaerolineae bacterium]|jgi:trehalose utilization protein|nr:trehalose utilization protein ThuA [Chloroflexota bacterium]
MAGKIRVTVWNEFRHEKTDKVVADVYPEGIHGQIASFLGAEEDIVTRTATLDEAEHGLTEEVLDETDVLIWWGHMAHGEVKDEIVDRVQKRILNGMGLIVLHSGHFSKIFRRMMGSNCSLKWREAGERERLWVVDPGHPIAAGLGEFFEIPHVEMYGELFDIPKPDATVFISWFQGGEVFRSGVAYHRGKGKVFYFRPGHETFPIYYQAEVQQVLKNAVRWAAPVAGPYTDLSRAPNYKANETFTVSE